MDRKQFLAEVWKPYPVPKNKTKDWCFGRVLAVEDLTIDLFENGDRRSISIADAMTVEDSVLGDSIPPALIRPGDWVACDAKHSKVWLLSPCLVPKPGPGQPDPLAWSRFLNKVKSFFVERSYSEIHTPFLVTSPGVDHHIDFLQVTASRTGRSWTLPTSPEIHLKKALCQGLEQVFEIKKCFRDDLPGPQHSVEFTMLEWYQAFASLDELQHEVLDFLHFLKPNISRGSVRALASVFLEYTDCDLKPTTSAQELRHWAKDLHIETQADDDWNDLFFRIFMEKVEPHLGQESPVIISDFPRQQASLAQINHRGWAERFEVYWQGVELANAYQEVNDPEENRQRFVAESELRSRSHKVVAPLDQDFFSWLDAGMPPASGIALGLDRLFRLLGRTTA